MARARAVVVAAVLMASAGGGAYVMARGFRAQPTGSQAKLFDQVLAHIAERYVDSIDVGTLYRQAAAGMVNELGDAHSVFLDSERLARVQASITGLIGALGLEIDTRDGWVNVVSAVAGTPAEQAGLRTGDRIVTVDGRITKNWTTDETRRALRGSPGTSVTLSIARQGVPGTTEVVLQREAVYIRPVQRAMMLAPGMGYVVLRTFSDSAALELGNVVDSLYKAGARRLILDLRGNPGGLISQGTGVADLFLNPGQSIVSLKGRTEDTHREYVDERKQQWADMRLAVLVNRGTASAAEIVAGALQDHDRAIVIGRRTYGKGSAQTVFSFPTNASGVKLTTSRWYTPAGRNIDLIPTESGADTSARQTFKTDSGRVVYGGGGILPDVIAGDSVNVARAALFAALGSRFRAFFDVLSAEAGVLAKRGISDPAFEVTPEMRNALFARLERSGPKVPRSVFDAASEWIDTQLGLEITRSAFGRAAENRRAVIRDRVVAEAMARLQ